MVFEGFFFFRGRVALYAILKAMGVGPGDEVILPGFTCVVVPNAIVYLGAKPVYVDIDPQTYNIDPDKIKDKITNKTKAIIAQHTFGIPAHMDQIQSIAREYNLYVIEDSCHTLGSKYKGKEVGSLSDAAFFSSQWSKPVTTGLGGWAVVNNQEVRENLSRIYNQFLEPSFLEVALLRLEYLVYSKFLSPDIFWFAIDLYRKLSSKKILVGSSESCELKSVKPKGYEKKMSAWQRQTLERQLKSLQQIINHRKWVTSQYEKHLKDMGIQTLRLPDYMEPVLLRYPILVKDKERVIQMARRERIELGDWFLSPVHPNLEGWEQVFYYKGMCPISEDICQRIVNLPTHTKIKEKEIEKTMEFLAKLKKEGLL